MAHVEGFNRSPSDVTGSRLLKNGLAPIVKQAFEEIYKAPFIVKMLLAELGLKPGRDTFLTMNYDGTFEELTGWAVLAASPSAQSSMHAWLRQHGHFNQGSLSQVLSDCLLAWGVGSLAQREEEQTETSTDTAVPVNVTADVQPLVPERDVVLRHVRQAATDMSIECAILARTTSGPSKYRALKPNELPELLSLDLNPTTNG
jgi:proteasome alpha subunit